MPEEVEKLVRMLDRESMACHKAGLHREASLFLAAAAAINAAWERVSKEYAYGRDFALALAKVEEGGLN